MKLKVLVLLLLLPNVSLISQENKLPCIAVLPFNNSSDDLQVGIISNNVRNTVELNLKMLNKYRIIHLDDNIQLTNEKQFKECCMENSIDNILFGTCNMLPEGSVTLQMSVYDRDKDRITLTQTERAKEVFDIFDASDRLAAEMIEKFSGKHIGFGSISLENKGVIGRYSVYIDKIFIGENITEVPTILYGERNISIIQERMLGEFLVKEDAVTVSEGENISFSYSIPGILEQEAAAIKKQEKIINRYHENIAKKKKVEKAFNSLNTVLAETDYSSAIFEKKKEIELKKKEWQYFCVHTPEDKKHWLFPVTAGIHNDKISIFDSDKEDTYSGTTYQFGAAYQFFEKIYPGLSVEIYTGYDGFFAVPVPSVIISDNPEKFLQKYEFLVIPNGDGSVGGVFGLGFAFRHILLEAEISIHNASSSVSAGYVISP